MRACRCQVKRALLRFSKHERRLATFAPPQHGSEGSHVEVAFDLCLVIAMTGETLLVEKRRDAADKKLLRLLIDRECRCRE